MTKLELGKYEFRPDLPNNIEKAGGPILESTFLDESVVRLKSIGFTHVGSWKLHGKEGLDFILPKREANSRNVLYAFVVDGRLKYIGKTVRTLAARMRNYRTPGKTQRTSKKNHEYILACLLNSEAVGIYFLPDNGLLNYGGFHINLAAGLEDDLIAKLDPPWNGGQKETENESLAPTIPSAGRDSDSE